MQLGHFFTSRRAGRRAAVAVEFALVTTFFLLPLFFGAADFICILNAQAQLNTALQALVYYSWTNNTAALTPASGTTTAAETALIDAINSASMFHVTLDAGVTPGSYSNLLYYCQTTTSPPYTITPSTDGTCTGSQTLQVYVQFEVSTAVSLPLPLPLANPLLLSATGSARVQ